MRIERDSMGEVEVPVDAYYGASTQRAVENFPISDLRFGRRFIWALGLIKGSAARVAGTQGHIEPGVADAVARAADEVRDGALDGQFVLDIFQTGSGTSTNTNANEVIAARASELLGGDLGSKLVHPNDQVNFGQSSNDVYLSDRSGSQSRFDDAHFQVYDAGARRPCDTYPPAVRPRT